MNTDSKMIFENYELMQNKNRVNSGFAKSEVLDGMVQMLQGLDKAETLMFLKMLKDNLPQHEFAEVLTSLTRHAGMKSVMPKLGEISKMFRGYKQETAHGMPEIQ